MAPVETESAADPTDVTSAESPTARTRPRHGDSVEVAAGDCLGRYTVSGLLGAGGMGEVYAAVDPELGRTVAIKVVHRDRISSPAARMRLVREAQALALVRHPNVVTVHDIGADHDPMFIAMELVEGPTLDKWLRAPARSWREIVATFIAAGRGLAAAHAAGIVHRDFKPSNVIVATDRVVVVDFGIARIGDDIEPDVETGSGRRVLDIKLTASGTQLGTSGYMSPEQCDSGDVTPQADQFAFCTALLEALDDKAPAAVRAIATRGLAEDPASRWPTMTTLIAALERRIARRARIASVLALLLVGVVIASFAGWRALSSKADKRVAAQQLSREAEQIRGSMRATRLLPVHDIEADRVRLRAQIATIQDKMAALGDEGRGPGEFALGAAWFSLSDRPDTYEEARKHLEAAWEAGERSPELAFELGTILVRTYQVAEQHVPPLDDAGRERHEAELHRTLRDPAIGYLRQAKGADTSPDYLEALIALAETRYDDAVAHGEAALRDVPTHYEAGLVVANALSHIVLTSLRAGDTKRATAAEDRMDATYRQIAETGRSDELVYRYYADALGAVAGRREADGEDVDAMLARVNELSAKGQAADSEAIWPDEMMARTYNEMGLNDSRHKRDPRAHFHAAIDAGERAIKRNPKSLHGQLFVGDAWGGLVDDWETPHGIDPRPSLAASIAAYQAAIAIAPDPDTSQNIAVSYGALARWQIAHGLDAKDAIESALRYSADAFRQMPNDTPNAHPNECSLLTDEARALLVVGLDPQAVLVRAQPLCDAAKRETPGDGSTNAIVARNADVRAIAEWRAGRDPRPAWTRADTDFKTALGLDATSSSAHAELARSLAAQAEYATQHHVDASELLQHGLAEARQAVKLDDDDGEALRSLAYVAVAAARAGNTTALEDGTQSAARVLSVNAEDPDALMAAAELELAAAHARPAAVATGLAFVARALAVNPHNTRALVIRAAFERVQGNAAAAEATLRDALAAGPLLASDPVAAR